LVNYFQFYFHAVLLVSPDFLRHGSEGDPLTAGLLLGEARLSKEHQQGREAGNDEQEGQRDSYQVFHG